MPGASLPLRRRQQHVPGSKSPTKAGDPATVSAAPSAPRPWVPPSPKRRPADLEVPDDKRVHHTGLSPGTGRKRGERSGRARIPPRESSAGFSRPLLLTSEDSTRPPLQRGKGPSAGLGDKAQPVCPDCFRQDTSAQPTGLETVPEKPALPHQTRRAHGLGVSSVFWNPSKVSTMSMRCLYEQK